MKSVIPIANRSHLLSPAVRIAGLPLGLFLMIAAVTTEARADDWPGWMGAGRDGVYSESGIIDAIPPGGLKAKWRHPIAGGYAGPAVADGRVFVFDYQRSAGEAVNSPNSRANLQGVERLIALDAETGEELWKHQYDCPYSISYPAGPRCTPTVDGDHVYILGSEGDLHCLNVANGDLVWARSFKKDFGAEVPIWGFASHPLIIGDLLYTMVGGDGQGIVAFDKNTGDVRWKALDTNAGYCPPTLIEAGGTRQLIAFHPNGITSLNPTNGEVFWTVDLAPMYEMSIARPMVDGDLMYASGIGSESVMLRLSNDQPAAEELWRGERDEALYSSNATPMFVDGILYGSDCHQGSLIAVDAKDGSRIWQSFRPTAPDATERQKKVGVKHGTAFVTRLGQSDRYLVFGQTGDLMIATLDETGFHEHGRFHAVDATGEAFGNDVVWTHPAYANRTAYIRNDKEIAAFDLSK
ncbi:PQQ-binding-like beta-propeller repeat protein [Crateriforma conspicua]|uniref:Outer membrane biogenesis protein BamB n=1 Tax=Crateriforma conspicua TaxID=2527996 RepID=A0A5C6FQH8_9PLAN|nr:PQQ-binding-like beta-propeller repeat protein [Crateriforma conspicua]TWU64486.1 outer membrane biogenesis protein BamB [Crateriforma conspicua]